MGAGALSVGGGADITLAALRVGRVARVGVAIASASIVLIYAAPIARAFTISGPQHVKALDALTLPNLRFPALHMQASQPAPAASKQAGRTTAATTPFFQQTKQAANHPQARSFLRTGAIAARRNWASATPATTVTNNVGATSKPPSSNTASTPATSDPPTVTANVGQEPTGFAPDTTSVAAQSSPTTASSSPAPYDPATGHNSTVDPDSTGAATAVAPEQTGDPILALDGASSTTSAIPADAPASATASVDATVPAAPTPDSSAPTDAPTSPDTAAAPPTDGSTTPRPPTDRQHDRTIDRHDDALHRRDASDHSHVTARRRQFRGRHPSHGVAHGRQSWFRF